MENSTTNIAWEWYGIMEHFFLFSCLSIFFAILRWLWVSRSPMWPSEAGNSKLWHHSTISMKFSYVWYLAFHKRFTPIFIKIGSHILWWQKPQWIEAGVEGCSKFRKECYDSVCWRFEPSHQESKLPGIQTTRLGYGRDPEINLVFIWWFVLVDSWFKIRFFNWNFMN